MFTLNAWLERSEPHLELRNDYTKQVVLNLSGAGLIDVLDDFGLAYKDLLENRGSIEIIKILLLATIKDYSKYKKLNVHALSNVLKFPVPKKSNYHQSEHSCSMSNDNVIDMNRFLSRLYFKKA